MDTINISIVYLSGNSSDSFSGVMAAEPVIMIGLSVIAVILLFQFSAYCLEVVYNPCPYINSGSTFIIGRAIAQAVSRRLPTAAARVQTWVGTWDFVMDKSGAGAGFIRELRFPLPIYIPSCSPQSSSLSPEAGTIGEEWPQCL
jgi:hypothetical protein